MPSYSLSEVIGHYQRKISRHQSDPAVLKHSLSKLGRLDGVSISVLQDTGVGRVVNALKKNADAEVAALAKELVLRWKQIVASEEEREEEEEEERGDDDEVGNGDTVPTDPSEDEEEAAEPEVPFQPKEEEELPKIQSSDLHHRHHKKSKSSRHDRDRGEDDDEERRRRRRKDRKRRDDGDSHNKERKSSSSSSSSRHKDKKRSHRDSRSPSASSSSSHNKHHHRRPRPSTPVESSAFDDALSADLPNSPQKPPGQKKVARRHSPSPGPSNGHHRGASPLPIPDGISPNYKPLPRKKEAEDTRRPQQLQQTQDEALSALIKGRGGRRTAVYSGAKRSGYVGEVPTLHALCVRVLQEHVDSIEECGGLPFDVMEPVLERAAPNVLANIEECNPYLMEDTGPLWERFVKKNFPNAKRDEEGAESWREAFDRFTAERERKLDRLKVKVKDSYARERDGAKRAKLAYVGLNAKPPRNVRAAQAKNGTAGSASGINAKRPGLNVAPVAVGASAAARKPKVAPMMAKTLKMARGMKGFRR